MLYTERRSNLETKAKSLGLSLEELALQLLFKELDSFDYRAPYQYESISFEEIERDLKI